MIYCSEYPNIPGGTTDSDAGAIELAWASAPKFLIAGARGAQHNFTGAPFKNFPRFTPETSDTPT